MIKRLFDFIVYSNLFIAGCAVAMIHQTYQLLLHSEPNVYFLLFVFFSTICSYSFHWYLTTSSVIPSPRIKWIHQNGNIHVVLFFTGLAGCGIFFFFLLPYWIWLLLSVVMTFFYSAPKIPAKHFRILRKMAFGKTIFLALVWMYVTTILPVLISGETWKRDFLLFILSRFFLIFSICILFDYRDREDDKIAGIRSLITFLSTRNIFILFGFSLTVFAIATTLMLQSGYSKVIIGVLLLPGIFTGSLYNYARNNFSDMLYYFVLDGLMAFSAIIMLIPGI